MQLVEFRAADGHVLQGSLYGEDNADAIIIAPAMSVPRRYYDAFAQYAADRRYAVLVFDYRGFGKSREGSIRRSKAKMSEWGALDLPAAIGFMRARGVRSLSIVAHSAGGQVAGLARNLREVDRMVFIASQSGYWRTWPGWRSYGLLLVWLAMPVATAILGFFPSRVVGLGSENLPRSVALQWSRWGRHPRYILGFGDDLDLTGYREYDKAIFAWSLEGDNYAPRRSVDALMNEYTSAKIERRHLEDARVGHFGIFRRGSEAYWQEMLDWITRDPDTPLSTAEAFSSSDRGTVSAPQR